MLYVSMLYKFLVNLWEIGGKKIIIFYFYLYDVNVIIICWKRVCNPVKSFVFNVWVNKFFKQTRNPIVNFFSLLLWKLFFEQNQ